MISSVNRFRAARGRILRGMIEMLASDLGRDIRILDVGGRPDYWENVGIGSISQIDLLNIDDGELGRAVPAGMPGELFVRRVGDACDLSGHADASYDLVHSNSVIEHVGDWSRMEAMAREMMRVGRAGWMQTPAWEFPVEPHFRTLFMHWFGRPMQVRMMSLSFERRVRRTELANRRRRVDGINLLSKREVRTLFPDRLLYVERVILAKSYVAHWLPEGLALRV
jgi:hypothetical protein